MKLLHKLNSYSLFTTLFFIFIFYLPFQKAFEKPLKFVVHLFSTQPKSICLNLYLSDFLIFGMLALCLFKGRSAFSLPKSGKFLLGFLLLALISIVASEHAKIFWAYYAWLLLLLPACLYFALARQLNVKESLTTGLWILFFASLIECAIAIAQYLHQAPLGLKSLGEPSYFPHIISPPWANSIFSTFNSSRLSSVIIRASGTLNHSNVLGAFLAVSILLSFYLYTQLSSTWKKILFFLALFIQELTLFLSFSRSALYGLIFCSFLWFGFFLFKKLPIKALLINFLLTLGIAAALLYPQLRDRGGFFNYNTFAKGADTARLHYMGKDLEKARQHPILGHGLHHCFFNMGTLSDPNGEDQTLQVHNIYLLLFAATGVLGLLFFLAFIGSIFVETLSAGLDPLSYTLATVLIFLLWNGCTDYLIIKSVYGRLLFFLTVGLLSAYTRETRKITTEVHGTSAGF